LYFLGNGAGNTVPKKLGWAILSPVGLAANANYKAANAKLEESLYSKNP